MIDGAIVLPNSRGTAPGQYLETEVDGQPRIIILASRAAARTRSLVEQRVHAALARIASSRGHGVRVLKTAMLPESAADARTAPIYKKYPNVETTVLAGQGQVEFHLRATASTQEEAQAAGGSSSPVNSKTNSTTLSSQPEASRWKKSLDYYLQMRNLKLAVAESCTGGMVAERITSVPGSSRFFLGGAVVYSNDLKTLFADVPPLMIEAHGAVSKEVALALGRKHSGDLQCRHRTGNHRHRRTGGRYRREAGRIWFTSPSTDGKKHEVVQRRFPGRSRTHPALGQPAGARPRPPHLDVSPCVSSSPSTLIPPFVSASPTFRDQMRPARAGCPLGQP